MTYKFVIHPVDLQDHDGFLSFLSHYAGQGYQAVQIHRSFTLFRRTDTPPAQYSMAFCPRTDRLADGLQPIPGLHNGILIVPQAGSPEARETWNQTVVADYAAFVPYNLISLLSKIIRFLVLPVVVLSVFLSFVKPILQDTASLPIPQAVLYPFSSFWLPGSLPSTCSPTASTPSTGPTQAGHSSGRPYATPPSLRPLVLLKTV
ncbi:MAG: hypothetical protein ACLS43_04030 [Evtepia gabavorous]